MPATPSPRPSSRTFRLPSLSRDQPQSRARVPHGEIATSASVDA